MEKKQKPIKLCPQCDQQWNGKLCKICGYEKPKPEKKQKILKPPKEKKPKEKPSEIELVKRYANQVIAKTKTRNFDDRNIDLIKNEGTTNRQLSMDTEFYFSVVFQSSKQKYEFLDAIRIKFGLQNEFTDQEKIQVVNGLSLAKSLGIELNIEKSQNYPIGDLELRPYVLDDIES